MEGGLGGWDLGEEFVAEASVAFVYVEIAMGIWDRLHVLRIDHA